MSTHNIGFYEDLTKNFFELSSNIIKYAPYFFCCTFQNMYCCKFLLLSNKRLCYILKCIPSSKNLLLESLCGSLNAKLLLFMNKMLKC